MALQTYALIKTAAGSIERRQSFESGEQPTLAVAKGLRWILDNPPAYDASRQRLVVTTPIAAEATSVPYTVETDPAHTERVARQNARQRVARQVDELRDKGDLASRVEALEIMFKELNLWP